MIKIIYPTFWSTGGREVLIRIQWKIAPESLKDPRVGGHSEVFAPDLHWALLFFKLRILFIMLYSIGMLLMAMILWMISMCTDNFTRFAMTGLRC